MLGTSMMIERFMNLQMMTADLKSSSGGLEGVVKSAPRQKPVDSALIQRISMARLIKIIEEIGIMQMSSTNYQSRETALEEPEKRLLYFTCPACVEVIGYRRS